MVRLTQIDTSWTSKSQGEILTGQRFGAALTADPLAKSLGRSGPTLGKDWGYP